MSEESKTPIIEQVEIQSMRFIFNPFGSRIRLPHDFPEDKVGELVEQLQKLCNRRSSVTVVKELGSIELTFIKAVPVKVA